MKPLSKGDLTKVLEQIQWDAQEISRADIEHKEEQLMRMMDYVQ